MSDPDLVQRHELALERLWTALARFMAPAAGPAGYSWEARAAWMKAELPKLDAAYRELTEARGDVLVAEHVHKRAGCCPPKRPPA